MNPSLRIKAVHLRVADLARSVAFYTSGLNFVVSREDASGVELTTPRRIGAEGIAPALLTLTGDRLAPRPPAGAAGLFHAALLLPSRAALGRWLRRADEADVEFAGFSDHGVSEAIYLTDPDGNGLEFYADRPRSAWPFNRGELEMVTLPLDVSSLLEAGASGQPGNPEEATLAGAGWGHLHFRVTELDRSEAFYESALGLRLMQRFGDSARFLAADGYHHHIGLNTWGGVTQSRPANALGLVSATIAASSVVTPQYVTDPDNIMLQLERLEPLAEE